MNSKKDRELGMRANITRRDFVGGAGVAIGTSMLPSIGATQDVGGQDLPGYYPPNLSGMRGSHPGSFEVAHMMRDGTNWDSDDIGEEYDLVVVGGGISGLSAAYFFRQAHGDSAKILILDNHDDFGGHAKRNEFEIDERLIIGYGGTMFMDAPSRYPRNAKRLIAELGIDPQRFYDAFDSELYPSLGLQRGVFFDKETFGRDHLSVGTLADSKTLESAPLSAESKKDLQRLYANDRHYLEDMTTAEQMEYLTVTDYRTYLSTRANVGDEALKAIESITLGVWAVSIDALPARTALTTGYPGFADLKLPFRPEDAHDEPNIFHFPDGNATIPRLLVRKMIPSVAPGDNMEDIVTARFDYGKLDMPGSNVRIRLNSTAVRVRHISDKPDSDVNVTYVREGKARTVSSAKVIMACYHGVIPHLCPEMPNVQRSGLSNSVRAPLVYTNVLIRNWSSFVNLGLQRASCPGSYHTGVTLDFPVSLGDYQCPKTPEEPMVLHLTRVPGQPGLSAREQFMAGKRDLLSTPFETFERNVRDQLGRMLGDGGFDPARDIAAITVNRWPHGYAYGYDPETDRVAFEPSLWPPETRIWEKSSRRFGNISIAASDAASNAMTEAAIEEAYRAVNDLG